jgi:Tfp pilus assembly protein PilO
MNNLTKTRRQFTLILGILGAIDLLLIVYLVLPGSSASGRLAQEQSLHEQVKTLKHDVAPLIGIDGKLAQTRVDVKHLYEQKVPSQFSQISQHLEKLMQETGVSTQGGIHYSQAKVENQADKHDLPDVQKIDINTTVIGEYAKVARFINALEQDKFVFVIDEISLNSQENGVISLSIKFQTFLKQS